MKFEEDNWREKDSMKETFVSVKARKERNEEEKEKYYLYQWLTCIGLYKLSRVEQVSKISSHTWSIIFFY
jgi:hypothetical protein